MGGPKLLVGGPCPPRPPRWLRAWYGITSITTMYRYLHQRNHLCSKIKLILSIDGHKQLLSHTETRNIFWVMDHTLLQKYRIYSSKNYFRLWILAEVEQLFCSRFQRSSRYKFVKLSVLIFSALLDLATSIHSCL